MTDTPPTAEQLAEDIADLAARISGLEAQLAITQRLVESLGDSTGKADSADQEPSAPPLILLLSGDDYDQELAALAIWVEHVLAPVYLTEVSSTSPWCQLWWEHLPAVARLHALWLAWQELTTPEAGGYTGPSVWARDHLRPTIDDLRSPSGPFAACATKPGQFTHTLLTQPTVQPLPLISPPS